MRKFFLTIICIFSCEFLFGQNLKTIDFSLIDTTISPADNFYKFASGIWLENNSIRDGCHRFGFYDLAQIKINNQLNQIMKNCVDNSNFDSDNIERNVGNFSLSGLDTIKTEQVGLNAINKQIEIIEKISGLKDLTEVLAYFQLSGIYPLFEIFNYKYWDVRGTHYPYLRQADLSLEVIEHYFEDKFKDKKEYLRKFISDILILTGIDSNTAEQYADLIITIETRMAKKSQSENRLSNSHKNYNLFTLEKLKDNYNNIFWNEYFQKIDVTETKAIIGQPEYFKEINKMLSEISLQEWKIYLKWRLLFKSAKYLSEDFSSRFYKYKRIIKSYDFKNDNREMFVMKTINKTLPNAIGHLYCKFYFKKDARIEVVKIIDNLRKAFAIRIKHNKWLSKKGKKVTTKKLNKIEFKIGGPKIETDLYSKLFLSQDSFIQNIFVAKEFETKLRLKKCGNKIQKTEWPVTAQSTNAWYGASRNDVTIPAGNINQLFNVNYDMAYNYGTFASSIAHEITHSLDNQGRLYDSDGEYIDWWEFWGKWKSSDVVKFNSLCKKLEKQFSSFVIIDTLKVNGKLTLGENIADLGGLNIAYDAFILAVNHDNEIENNSYSAKQRFFIAFAQKWRDLLSDKLKEYYAAYYMHSPPKYRTNGIVYNIDSFYEAFKINNGTFFKEEKIIIW